MIKAIVFDFDGVIIDTETPHYQSWQEVFELYGARLARSEWTRFIGAAEGMDIRRHLEDQTGIAFDHDKLKGRQRARYLSMVDANPVMPGVVEWIDDAARNGISLGIASSSDRQWVVGHLTTRGLMHKFTAIKSRDDVDQAKPHPGLFLAAVDALGVRPEEAMAIEDSAHGVTAAKGAGLYTVVVPNEMTRDLTLDHADVRLDSLDSVPMRQLADIAEEHIRSRS